MPFQGTAGLSCPCCESFNWKYTSIGYVCCSCGYQEKSDDKTNEVAMKKFTDNKKSKRKTK